jgi:plastocyanin
VISLSLSRLVTALFATTFVLACSGDAASHKRAPSTAAAATKIEDSAAGSVDLGSGGYAPGRLSAVGSVSGNIKLDGPVPRDTTTIAGDPAGCTTTPEAATVATPKGVSNAIVWIAGAKTGKYFPVEKRADLSSEKCVLDPRVQAVVAGTTVNVSNDDRMIHKLVFIRGNDTLTRMPFFNSGETVASERIAAKPGVVEVRCALHPWMRGYVVVFDHPYFTVTDANGGFTIDSLPPGPHTLMVWHEGMARPITQQIQVAANGTAKADLAIRVVR